MSDQQKTPAQRTPLEAFVHEVRVGRGNPMASGAQKRAWRLAAFALRESAGLTPAMLDGFFEFVRLVESAPAEARRLIGA